jgi:hypothetical protein
MIAATLIALAATMPAHATLDAGFKCTGFRTVPSERIDRDPIVSADVSFGEKFDRRGRRLPDYLSVVHTTFSGREYDREKQYRHFQHWVQNTEEDSYHFWSGVNARDPRRTMVGELRVNDYNTMAYMEKAYLNGHLEHTTISTCVAE